MGLILCKLSGGMRGTKGHWTLVMVQERGYGTSGLRDLKYKAGSSLCLKDGYRQDEVRLRCGKRTGVLCQVSKSRPGAPAFVVSRWLRVMGTAKPVIALLFLQSCEAGRVEVYLYPAG
jgi:hypothetical protein